MQYSVENKSNVQMPYDCIFWNEIIQCHNSEYMPMIMLMISILLCFIVHVVINWLIFSHIFQGKC